MLNCGIIIHVRKQPGLLRNGLDEQNLQLKNGWEEKIVTIISLEQRRNANRREFENISVHSL